jgi:hypothetical protein
MLWKTIFVSFFLSNRNIIKKRLGSSISSEQTLESNNSHIINTNDYLEAINKIRKTRFSNVVSGYDLRYNETDKSSMNNISRYFNIIKTLEIIESNRISVNDKLDIIEQYNDDMKTKYVPNINANNLISDW